jgi:hypothetical protein
MGFAGKLPDSEGKSKIIARVSIPRKHKAADGADLYLKFK